MGWRRQWRLGAYGTLNPSRTRRVAVDTTLVAILLAVYGLWTDFVPSPLVAKGGLYLAVAVSLALCLFISHGHATGRIAWAMKPPLWGRLLVYATFFGVIYCAAWMIFVRVAPDIVTRIVGKHESKTMVLEADSRFRKHACDDQLQGPELGFPGYLCIPNGVGPFARRAEVILSGKATVLGMHVSHIEPGNE